LNERKALKRITKEDENENALGRALRDIYESALFIAWKKNILS